MFGSFPPSPLVGLRLQSLLGPRSRHCYGIITLKTPESRVRVLLLVTAKARLSHGLHQCAVLRITLLEGVRFGHNVRMPNLTDHGDAVERSTWPTMKSYISKYETLWQMHVEPLRNPGSIALRRGIDPDFEVFAMNHYSTYIN